MGEPGMEMFLVFSYEGVRGLGSIDMAVEIR